jgi:hypothetical protein
VKGKGGYPNLKLRDNKKLRPVLDMHTNHSHVKVIQYKPTVLQWVNGLTKGETESLCDQCDHPTDSFAKNLDGNNRGLDGSLGVDGNGKEARDCYKGPKGSPKNISEVSGVGAHRSQRSHSKFRCYYCDKAGILFETDYEPGYEKHGALKHPNKSLYPNLATIRKHNLNAQGRDWEI